MISPFWWDKWINDNKIYKKPNINSTFPEHINEKIFAFWDKGEEREKEYQISLRSRFKYNSSKQHEFNYVESINGAIITEENKDKRVWENLKTSRGIFKIIYEHYKNK